LHQININIAILEIVKISRTLNFKVLRILK